MGQGSGGFWEDVVPVVDPERCQRCADCPAEATCPAKGFRRADADSVPQVDQDFCFGCYACAAACPHRAVMLPRRR